jgi:hypothetical protein
MMMELVVLYCKSYLGDLMRIRRLATSVERYNVEKIPFYVSAPSVDLPQFQEVLSDFSLMLIPDEQIISSNSMHNVDQLAAMPGTITQQIVKSEFWRLGLCENYVCLDSDNEFIRQFTTSDFIAPDGHPYTVITEGKEFLEFSVRYHLPKVTANFEKDCLDVQRLFGRKGKMYSFGIPPLVWSKHVWISLEREILIPKNISLAELIVEYPHELRLYGEALLNFRAIPLWPSEDFFKNYLYQSQYFYDKKRGITTKMISKNYLGIVRQSNWEGEHFGIPRKSFWSRLLKKIKRIIRWLSV